MERPILTVVVLVLAAVAHADDASKPRPVREPELRDELLRRARADQDARTAITKWMRQFGSKVFWPPAGFEASLDTTRKSEFKRLTETMRRIDTENANRLKEIVERRSWPTYSLVGKDGAKAAWLLVQHADLSPGFQRKCLDLMARVPPDEISSTNVAYLTDRVLLAEGKKQIYGTQFLLVNGKWKPRPIQDELNVDKRRAEAGLPPLAVYTKEIETYYGGTLKK